MHVKFYAEPATDTPGHWQVLGEKCGRTFLIDVVRSKAAAFRAIRSAERTALFCGAVVIA